MLKKLRQYLDENGVKYAVLSHSPAYTAQEVARTTHIPGKEMAKVVIVSIDGEMAMCVLPASYHVHFNRLCSALHGAEVHLVSESDFTDRFPECEPGAMPPFGNLFGMAVFVARSLAEDEEIAFNAGTHTETVRMRYADFARIAQPKVISFTDRPVAKEVSAS